MSHVSTAPSAVHPTATVRMRDRCRMTNARRSARTRRYTALPARLMVIGSAAGWPRYSASRYGRRRARQSGQSARYSEVEDAEAARAVTDAEAGALAVEGFDGTQVGPLGRAEELRRALRVLAHSRHADAGVG